MRKFYENKFWIWNRSRLKKMEPSFLEKIILEIPQRQCENEKCEQIFVDQEFRTPTRIFPSRKRNFNEILCEDSNSKKVHGMPGVRLQQENFQFYLHWIHSFILLTCNLFRFCGSVDFFRFPCSRQAHHSPFVGNRKKVQRVACIVNKTLKCKIYIYFMGDSQRWMYRVRLS